jgi:hypothetical protein
VCINQNCLALTPLPSSIGGGFNPRPSDHEPSAPLPPDHSFRHIILKFAKRHGHRKHEFFVHVFENLKASKNKV